MKPADTAAPIDYYQLVEDVLTAEDVHDASVVTEATATNGLFVVLALILTLVHGFNLYLLLATSLWPIIPVIIHLAVVGVTAILTYAQYKKGLDVQHLAMLTIVSATTSIFGTLGALFGFVGTLIFRARSQHFAEWYASIFPTDTPSDAQVIYDSILEGIDENPSHYGVMPFVDVMRLGSENQKRRALAKMTSRFSPRFSPAFKVALADSSNTIRVQAATAIAKIERDFGQRLERIEEARVREPRNTHLTMALAKFYDDYAFTGILDSELEKLNRERAVNTYKSYLQQDPNSSDAWVSIGRLLFRDKKWAEAADWFRHALDRGWKMNHMLMWYFECLFRLGQFRELRRALLEYGRGIVNQEEMPKDVREAVSLWMQVA
ncbi:MAG: tetratricopeptide repeat protein [Rickettsiales bacterium]